MNLAGSLHYWSCLRSSLLKITNDVLSLVVLLCLCSMSSYASQPVTSETLLQTFPDIKVPRVLVSGTAQINVDGKHYNYTLESVYFEDDFVVHLSGETGVLVLHATENATGSRYWVNGKVPHLYKYIKDSVDFRMMAISPYYHILWLNAIRTGNYDNTYSLTADHHTSDPETVLISHVARPRVYLDRSIAPHTVFEVHGSAIKRIETTNKVVGVLQPSNPHVRHKMSHFHPEFPELPTYKEVGLATAAGIETITVKIDSITSVPLTETASDYIDRWATGLKPYERGQGAESCRASFRLNLWEKSNIIPFPLLQR